MCRSALARTDVTVEVIVVEIGSTGDIAMSKFIAADRSRPTR
jgi:hypothetical protein